jgi:hypothetical protein
MASLFSSINYFLRKIGFQIIRVRTLDLLTRPEHDRKQSRTERAARPSVSCSKDTLEVRLDALEARTEQSIQNLIRYTMKAYWRNVDLIDQLTGADKPSICPLCGQDAPLDGFKEIASNCIFHGGRLLRHERPNCNVIFGPEKMFALDSEMIDLEYRNLYRIYSEGNTTNSMVRTFHLLKPKKTGFYLDFGCGGEWSEAIQLLRAEGWNIYGFEPSATHSSQQVFSNWDELIDKKFDGILSHNVLEHLLDPAGTTKRLSNLLTDDGRIVHATACFEYRYHFTRFHVYFFTGKSSEILAEQAGMRIVDWVRDGEYIACALQKSA